MDALIIKFYMPLSLFVMMLGMGFELVKDDFSRIFRKPKAIILGLVSQMIGLPLLGFFIVKVFQLDYELALGLMILTFCPGGIVSNVFSYLAKADVGLSVTLTAITGMLSPFTVTLLGGLASSYLSTNGQEVPFPVVKTMMALIVLIILPIIIGMAIREKKPKFAKRYQKPTTVFSSVSLLIIILALMFSVGDQIFNYLIKAGPAALSLNVLSMLLGLGVAKIFQLQYKQAITLSLEVGLQNAITAMVITSQLMKNDVMAISPSTYGLLMFIPALLLVVIAPKIHK